MYGQITFEVELKKIANEILINFKSIRHIQLGSILFALNANTS